MYIIQELAPIQVTEVINNYKPLGLFYVKDEKLFVGIDNSDGNAWVEEFRTKASCIKWLKGKPVKDAHGYWHNR